MKYHAISYPEPGSPFRSISFAPLLNGQNININLELSKLYEQVRLTALEAQKKVAGYQQAIKKSQEEAAARQEKFLERLKEIRASLIEALANYGDSLTQVKPEEYVNIVLQKDLYSGDQGREKESLDIISAKKSWITDYKAGRITLENFKQQVLQYTE